MEERMIDDEYGRGVKLRKTKDGYVDVTDEALDENDESVIDAEEINFEFPNFEEGEMDEDWIGLSPEELEKRRKEKEEEENKRRLQYEESVQKGQELLDQNDLEGAAKAFKKAMKPWCTICGISAGLSHALPVLPQSRYLEDEFRCCPQCPVSDPGI